MSTSRSKRNKIAHVRNGHINKQIGRCTQLKYDAAKAANAREWARAIELLEAVLEQHPDDVEAQEILARVYHHSGQIDNAKSVLKALLDIHPELTASLARLAQILAAEGQFEAALPFAERALAIHHDFPEALSIKAHILHALGRFTDTLKITKELIQLQPDNYVHWNNAGNFLRDLGKFDEAEKHYQRAISLTNEDTRPFSNLLTTKHYRPDASENEIYDFCLEWEKRFSPKKPTPRPSPENKKACRKLYIGLISDGFRNHPVGRMIIAALEKLPKHAYQFYAYSTNNISDDITRRFKKICNWQTISHFNDHELAEKIRGDRIDILIDLAGYHNNSRMLTMAKQPAPLLVKWVGGLINTTGLSTIDYLITDHIESPTGDDRYYTEKLIRMPDDYICYEPPGYIAPLSKPPALENGYITLGCFNNPCKINEPLLKEWALLMQQLPDSRLFLKGKQYSSEELCDNIRNVLNEKGIESYRIIFEGLSPHAHVFRAYNHVDIALDPWPYSGGLTTCEAFMMGVPVVTMSGPTFAGRHSATHLVNAGMPELVTHSWEEYRSRVLELASDLDSLAIIRSHLRTVLLQSPVCDADAFASHLNNALRAIWQRYCEGKQPEALSFNGQGQVTFADSPVPVTLQHTQADVDKADEDSPFRWEFEGKVVAINLGSQLMNAPIIKQMLDLGTLELIDFDPSCIFLNHPLRHHNSVHYYPNMALGNGHSATLYACQAEEQSGVLKPAPHDLMPQRLQQDLKVLAELKIGTVSLDLTKNIPTVNWLIIDGNVDAEEILNNSLKVLKDVLILQVSINFLRTHKSQPKFERISEIAQEAGLFFYNFFDYKHLNNEKQNSEPNESQLISASAIFLRRNKSESSSNIMKQAFLINNFYKNTQLTYNILMDGLNKKLANKYIRFINGDTHHSKTKFRKELKEKISLHEKEVFIYECTPL